MAERRDDLDRWVEHGLISDEQRAAIVSFERERVAMREEGPGRLADAVSTVGAAVAISAVAGIIALFAQDWSAGQTMAAAIAGSVVMVAAAWLLVLNGWGAPGGLCAVCGLVLMPVALRYGAELAGWWPEHSATRDPLGVERDREQVIGMALLLSILPGLVVERLGLRQFWAALPPALWLGAAFLLTNPFDNVPLMIAQVVASALLAGLAVFVWRPEESGRGTAWWLQLGGLLLAAQGIIFSIVEERTVFALLAAFAAAVIFVVGATRGRTAWMVVGAVAGLFPVGRVIFDYFEGLTALFIVAILGLVLTFVPLILWRRGYLKLSSGG